jgi:predicted DNA-binding WGR domain protein
MPLANGVESAELVKLVPAQNQARFYRLAIWPDLFGGVSLVREYGRLGQSGGRLRRDPFPDQDAASRALQRILKRKLRRGYEHAVRRDAIMPVEAGRL